MINDNRGDCKNHGFCCFRAETVGGSLKGQWGVLKGRQNIQYNHAHGNRPLARKHKNSATASNTSSNHPTLQKADGPPLFFFFYIGAHPYFFFSGGGLLCNSKSKISTLPQGICKVLTNPLFSDRFWWDLHWILIENLCFLIGFGENHNLKPFSHS